MVFDLDGTLVDTMACILATYVNTIRLLGGLDIPSEDVLSKLLIGPARVMLSRGRPPSPAARIRFRSSMFESSDLVQ